MTAEFTIQINSIFSGTLTINLPAGAITDQFGSSTARPSRDADDYGHRPRLRLPVGSGRTQGLAGQQMERAAGLPPMSNTRLHSVSPLRMTSRYSRRTILWGSTFIKDAITANGHTYTEFTPDLATVNFSDYRVARL